MRNLSILFEYLINRKKSENKQIKKIKSRSLFKPFLRKVEPGFKTGGGNLCFIKLIKKN